MRNRERGPYRPEPLACVGDPGPSGKPSAKCDSITSARHPVMITPRGYPRRATLRGCVQDGAPAPGAWACGSILGGRPIRVPCQRRGITAFTMEVGRRDREAGIRLRKRDDAEFRRARSSPQNSQNGTPASGEGPANDTARCLSWLSLRSLRPTASGLMSGRSSGSLHSLDIHQILWASRLSLHCLQCVAADHPNRSPWGGLVQPRVPGSAGCLADQHQVSSK